ncbi:Na+/H+ antiporter NhaC family protein [Clostridium senegalense]|uniref:Na+/H+ antiporter NhaC family protein n=1 Tax=Clostridium senegalense TaxID=1465809 RepID=A0A6M0H7T7_9CLOT|nr:Na+/H+ antiporter NhaC family protein [Clostridium senegalense]NEU06607.1 Na+/H+ antiporter NhaC family protein [Clostridium senegalense]
MKKKSIIALMPLLVFIVIYFGVAIILKDFYAISVVVPFLIASIVALIQNRERTFDDKVISFCKGGGNPDIIMMCLIFILAGAFGETAKSMGAVESTVNLGINFLPSFLLVPGIFLMAGFISTSIGTSMGTIAAFVPIALGISEKTGISLGLIVGAVVGASILGDNLSMISDTTIAAAKTQNADLKDKFKVNFKITLPSAIVTMAILVILTLGKTANIGGVYEYQIIKVIPYIFVLASALMGVNVITVLTGGVAISAVIGFITKDMTLKLLVDSIATGALNMGELIIVSILIGGIVEIIKDNGGIEFIISFIASKIKSKRGAELGIAILVSIVNLFTANNTISIVTVGPMAKEISETYDLDSSRVATLLDVFSCVIQSLIPYGAQLLSAAALSALSPFAILKYTYYPVVMGVFTIIFIFGVKDNKKDNKVVVEEKAV